MKNLPLTAISLLVLLISSASPSLAQFNQNNSSSSSSSSSMQFMAPNYWGDARVKNRSTAVNNSQGSGSAPMSGGRSGGGGGMSPFMFMGPAMMLPAMMRTTLGRGVHPNHKIRRAADDEEQSPSKHKKSKNQKPSVNDENNMPDPLVPMNSSLSKKTFDLQNGNGSALTQEQQMRVSGIVQDEEVSGHMQAPLQDRDFAPAHNSTQSPAAVPGQGQGESAAMQAQPEASMQAKMPASGVDLQGVDF